MHLVSLALEPAKESADAVPPFIFVVFISVFAGTFFAFDDEILIRPGQFLERNIDVDVFARACAKQVLLRFAKLSAAKNADDALFDAQVPVWNRLIQVDRNRTPKTAAFRTRAQRVVKTKQARCGRPNVQIAIRTMPARGEREFVISGR